MALLLDVAARYGVDAIAQVNLGSRSHRNRSLADLAPQAREVLAAALERAGVATS
jgi:glucosyl-3-phosphoglycerate synthase